MNKKSVFIAIGFFLFSDSLLLNGCEVGPDYHRPCVQVPIKYKEADKHWKVAQPNDACNRGQWWVVFHDPKLEQLESQVDISNQNIVAAKANYEQSLALVDEARAAYF